MIKLKDMELSKKQIKKANYLLKALCESEHMIGEKIYSFFDSPDETKSICYILEKYQYLYTHSTNKEIIKLTISDKTCLGINQSSLNTPKPKSIIYKFVRNPIIQIMSIIVILYTFLKIVESIFKIDIPII